MPHTPAPWHADEHMRIVGANGDVICDVDPFDVLDAAQANLALIAAAPALLEACQMVLEYENQRGDPSATAQIIRETLNAAIAKAEAA
jgi:hypothetical protein